MWLGTTLECLNLYLALSGGLGPQETYSVISAFKRCESGWDFWL